MILRILFNFIMSFVSLCFPQALALRENEIERAKKYYVGSLTYVENLFKEIVVQKRLDFINSSIPQFVKEENRPGIVSFIF